MNPGYRNKVFPSLNPLPFDTNFPAMVEPNALSFLLTCLTYDPKSRPDALEALAHPFFDEIKKERKLLPNGNTIPISIFEFT